MVSPTPWIILPFALLLVSMAAQRERYSDSAMTAIANHSDPAAEAALKRYLDPNQPSPVRVRAVSAR